MAREEHEDRNLPDGVLLRTERRTRRWLSRKRCWSEWGFWSLRAVIVEPMAETEHLARRNAQDQRPFDERGRVVSRACQDPHCGGTLVAERVSFKTNNHGRTVLCCHWVCDGLTHAEPNGALFDCDFSHSDGDPFDPSNWVSGQRRTNQG